MVKQSDTNVDDVNFCKMNLHIKCHHTKPISATERLIWGSSFMALKYCNDVAL